MVPKSKYFLLTRAMTNTPRKTDINFPANQNWYLSKFLSAPRDIPEVAPVTAILFCNFDTTLDDDEDFVALNEYVLFMQKFSRVETFPWFPPYFHVISRDTTWEDWLNFPFNLILVFVFNCFFINVLSEIKSLYRQSFHLQNIAVLLGLKQNWLNNVVHATLTTMDVNTLLCEK